jgi:hypothetical protein
MPVKQLHIICLNVPYPVDFGANFEQFNKIRALYNAGVGIHLHCFLYGDQQQQPVLSQFCLSVQYYRRKKKVSLRLPYIVSSRINEQLFQNLLKDDLPVLMEGAHCSYLVFDKRFANRRLFVRAYNAEYLYYRGLYQPGKIGFKNWYYRIESRLLYRYEKKLVKKACIFCLSAFDKEHFEKEFGAKNIQFIPLFFEGRFKTLPDSGIYCFYQGNLSVPENEAAVTWLLENVFSNINIPFVIAGKNPSKKLVALVHRYPHTCIAINPSNAEMDDLMQKAQINILPSVNATGIKIKIIQALFNGRYCITNANGANGFANNDLFYIAEDADTFKMYIKQLINRPFTDSDLEQRKVLLGNSFEPDENAKKLIKWIY